MPIFSDQQISEHAELSKVESLRKLERALLRIAITVEEAEGRLITNKAMLQQLKMLRQEMHKGYYVLDKFRYLDEEEEGKLSGRRSRSLALSSTSNPGKRFPSSATRRWMLEKIFEVSHTDTVD
ncbi:hypothetical protein C2845_PM06G27520 [Panicum miliaceum]|uniref:Uncharacterized protein n=1 Tax=Panicum miliaceum TaxID=4540 RepID=A0A3L6RFE1_PANMI|nr:hypothetical protein C2845_PM06G27520 [Panicum miliaceum]